MPGNEKALYTMASRRQCAVPGRSRQQGIALIVVLWVLALVGSIAVVYSAGIRNETIIAHNTIESAKARSLVEAGMHIALMHLCDRSSNADEEAWLTDGTVYETGFDGGTIRIAMVDESGKIDLNAAPRELLHSMLLMADVPYEEATALTDAIIDWRDEDEVRSLHGAEDEEYADAGLEYGAKDAPFESVEELLLVLGMRPEWYRAIEPAVTVYSGNDSINPLAASDQVLKAVPGINASQVDQYLELRQERASEAQSLSFSLLGRNPYLTTNVGNTFSLYIEGVTGNGATAKASVVIRLKPRGIRSGYEVLAWKESGNIPISMNQSVTDYNQSTERKQRG